MKKISKLLKSRTAWTVVIMFIINVVAAYHDSIPKDFVGLVDALLSVLAVYFHANPKQEF